MIKGKTSSGFSYQIPKARLSNYELFEVIGKASENPMYMPRVVEMLLGEEQKNKLLDFLRDKDGFVDITKVEQAVTEIFDTERGKKSSS